MAGLFKSSGHACQALQPHSNTTACSASGFSKPWRRTRVAHTLLDQPFTVKMPPGGTRLPDWGANSFVATLQPCPKPSRAAAMTSFSVPGQSG